MNDPIKMPYYSRMNDFVYNCASQKERDDQVALFETIPEELRETVIKLLDIAADAAREKERDDRMWSDFYHPQF